MANRKQQELDRIKQETSQRLSELQPNIPDINTSPDLSVTSVFKFMYENIKYETSRLREPPSGSEPDPVRPSLAGPALEPMFVEDEYEKSAKKNPRLRGSVVRPTGTGIVKGEVEKIEKKRLRGSVPKPETEQASGSAEQPRYKQPSEDDFWNNRTVKELKHELSLRGFRKSKNPDGSQMKRHII